MSAGSLVAENASVRLGERVVLQDFSVTVSPGELVAIAGANGAGKSTALKLMAGLLPPLSGSVALDGRRIETLPRHELGRNIAYLPQDRIVHWGLAAERLVALGRLPHKKFSSALSAADNAAVTAAMARTDVTRLRARPISQLSGGERARVLLARALAQDARYLIADEPTSGLDPAHTLTLFEELKRLTHDGKAVITALHDIALAARFATRILLFKDGRCIADGPPAESLSRNHLAEAFNIDANVSQVEGIPVFLPRSALRD